MKNIDLTTQTDIEEPRERSEARDSEENVPRTHQRTEISEKDGKRARFDSNGNPLVSKGILIRKDLDKKYLIKAKVMGKNKYELVNDALEYYYENVLMKTQSQKLVEAGQGALEV